MYPFLGVQFGHFSAGAIFKKKVKKIKINKYKETGGLTGGFKKKGSAGKRVKVHYPLKLCIQE